MWEMCFKMFLSVTKYHLIPTNLNLKKKTWTLLKTLQYFHQSIHHSQQSIIMADFVPGLPHNELRKKQNDELTKKQHDRQRQPRWPRWLRHQQQHSRISWRQWPWRSCVQQISQHPGCHVACVKLLCVQGQIEEEQGQSGVRSEDSETSWDQYMCVLRATEQMVWAMNIIYTWD